MNGIDGYIQSRRFSRVEGSAEDLALVEFEDFGFLENDTYRSLLLSDDARNARKTYGEVLHKLYARYVPTASGEV